MTSIAYFVGTQNSKSSRRSGASQARSSTTQAGPCSAHRLSHIHLQTTKKTVILSGCVNCICTSSIVNGILPCDHLQWHQRLRNRLTCKSRVSQQHRSKKHPYREAYIIRLAESLLSGYVWLGQAYVGCCMRRYLADLVR